MLLFPVLVAVWFVIIGKIANVHGRFWPMRLFLSFMIGSVFYAICIVSTAPYLLMRTSAITETKVKEVKIAEMKEGIYLVRNISKDGFFITDSGKKIEVLGKNKIIVCTSGLSKPKAEIIHSKLKGWWVNMVFLWEPCFEEHRIWLSKATQIQNLDIEYR